jgi:hypothetical protein
LSPGAYDAIGAISDKTQGAFEVGLIFAVLAGISEETLFRGALQPRAGILISALLFATIHVQYGATPVVAFVFVHGLAYGWLRRSMNTTTAIIAHTTYDVIPSLPVAAVFWLLFGGLALGMAGIRADGRGWSKYVVPLAAAGAFSVLGSGVIAFTGSVTAWKLFGVAALLAMAVAIVLEGMRSRSLPLLMGGSLAWLIAAVIVWSVPWPGGAALFALPTWFISVLAGLGAWYRLAFARHEPS